MSVGVLIWRIIITLINLIIGQSINRIKILVIISICAGLSGCVDNQPEPFFDPPEQYITTPNFTPSPATAELPETPQPSETTVTKMPAPTATYTVIPTLSPSPIQQFMPPTTYTDPSEYFCLYVPEGWEWESKDKNEPNLIMHDPNFEVYIAVWVLPQNSFGFDEPVSDLVVRMPGLFFGHDNVVINTVDSHQEGHADVSFSVVFNGKRYEGLVYADRYNESQLSRPAVFLSLYALLHGHERPEEIDKVLNSFLPYFR